MVAVCLDLSPIKRQFDTRAALLFDLPGVADKVGRKNRDQFGAQRFEQMPQFFVIDMRKVEFARQSGTLPFVALCEAASRWRRTFYGE